jgi:hypothetical protein
MFLSQLCDTRSSSYIMLCYVMLCYVMLCYAMLCYVMLFYNMLFRVYVIISFLSFYTTQYAILIPFCSIRIGLQQHTHSH